MSASVFAVTSRHAEWLASRRNVIAGNIAHANTPMYKAQDIAPFTLGASADAFVPQRTAPAHLLPLRGDAAAASVASAVQSATHSGNTVNLEAEMMKAAEISRDHAMNTAITRSFHRMVLLAVRG